PPPHPHSFPTRRSSDLTVTDRCDGLACLGERLHETLHERHAAELVRVHLSTGQDERVVIIGLRTRERNVDVELVAPLDVLPTLQDRKSTRLNSSHVAIS